MKKGLLCLLMVVSGAQGVTWIELCSQSKFSSQDLLLSKYGVDLNLNPGIQQCSYFCNYIAQTKQNMANHILTKHYQVRIYCKRCCKQMAVTCFAVHNRECWTTQRLSQWCDSQDIWAANFLCNFSNLAGGPN